MFAELKVMLKAQWEAHGQKIAAAIGAAVAAGVMTLGSYFFAG